MTLEYLVVSPGEEQDDYFIYLRTLDGTKANKLLDILLEEYPDVEIITKEVDNPVYYLDLEYPDGHVQFNVVCVGKPEDDPELGKVIIKRKKRLV